MLENITIPDNLTREQRRLLYDPSRYDVQEVESGEWLVLHCDVPAVFTARKLNNRGTLEVRSNTNGEHVVDYHNRGCTCIDSQERARAEGRPCKHMAVAEAVAGFCDRQREEKRIAAITAECARIEEDGLQAAKFEARRANLAAWGEIAEQIGLLAGQRYSG